MSHVSQHSTDSSRYAKCIEVSKRIRWDTDRDVIRGRQFDFGKKFLPDGLSKVAQLPFLTADEQRLFSQVQGRTYANMFALVERFIGAKVLEISRGHWLGDQVALEALVRLTDEELKHQEMFRRLETMMAPGMPAGYRFLPQPNDVAQAVLAASTWAVLALTCDIELFSQAHYRSSIDPETADRSAVEGRVPVPLEGGVAARDPRRDGVAARGRAARRGQRDQAVDELIGLVGAVDGICRCRPRPTPSTSSQVAGRDVRRAIRRTRSSATMLARLPLAVHRQRRAGSALPRAARLDDQRRTGRAHQRGAGADRRHSALTKKGRIFRCAPC